MMGDLFYEITEFFSFGLIERPILIPPTMTTVEIAIENGQPVVKSMKTELWENHAPSA
jgi:hypothetical protein